MDQIYATTTTAGQSQIEGLPPRKRAAHKNEQSTTSFTDRTITPIHDVETSKAQVREQSYKNTLRMLDIAKIFQRISRMYLEDLTSTKGSDLQPIVDAWLAIDVLEPQYPFDLPSKPEKDCSLSSLIKITRTFFRHNGVLLCVKYMARALKSAECQKSFDRLCVEEFWSNYRIRSALRSISEDSPFRIELYSRDDKGNFDEFTQYVKTYMRQTGSSLCEGPRTLFLRGVAIPFTIHPMHLQTSAVQVNFCNILNNEPIKTERTEELLIREFQSLSSFVIDPNLRQLMLCNKVTRGDGTLTFIKNDDPSLLYTFCAKGTNKNPVSLKMQQLLPNGQSISFSDTRNSFSPTPLPITLALMNVSLDAETKAFISSFLSRLCDEILVHFHSVKNLGKELTIPASCKVQSGTIVIENCEIESLTIEASIEDSLILVLGNNPNLRSVKVPENCTVFLDPKNSTQPKVNTSFVESKNSLELNPHYDDLLKLSVMFLDIEAKVGAEISNTKESAIVTCIDWDNHYLFGGKILS